MQRLDFLSRRLVHPGERIRNQLGELRHLATRLAGAWERHVEDLGWRAREAGLRLVARAPDVPRLRREGRELARRLREGARRQLETATALLARLDGHLRHLNPQSVLERGYSITESADGGIVRDSARLAVGDDLKITFARGWAGAQVKRKE
jgi:exodeoxyribonuclease VII large subunit